MLRLPSKSSFTLSKLRFWSLHKPWTLLFIHPQQKEDDFGHPLFYLFFGLNESGLRVIFFQRIFNVKNTWIANRWKSILIEKSSHFIKKSSWNVFAVPKFALPLHSLSGSNAVCWTLSNDDPWQHSIQTKQYNVPVVYCRWQDNEVSKER